MKKLIFRLAQVLCCLSFILMLLQYSLVLKYAKEGLFVWASCVLPLLLPFIILSKFWIRYEIPQLFFKQVHRLVPAVTKLSNKKPPALSLSEEVFLPSLEIIFIIGIYMMIFSILSGMLTSFPLFQVPVFTFVLANLEVTTGIHLLALKPFITPQIQYALIAAATSFGGLCTMAQVQTVLSATDLSLKRYIVIKTGTAFVSFLLCLILLR